MIAVRTLFAAVMAVMVAGTVASSSSSSSTGSVASSSGIASMSSSSTVIPGYNDSSSSDVWIVSSSSTGADAPFYYPAGTYEVIYTVESLTSTIAAGLSSALAKDFAATVGEAYNMTSEILSPYILVNVKQPESSSAFHIMQVGPMNVTATAVVLGNVTNIISPVIALDLAQAFAAAARNGSVIFTETAAYANIYPQEVQVVESAQPGDDDNTNGASAASASLLIGSMVAALALAF
jgi:hypothetical protein